MSAAAASAARMVPFPASMVFSLGSRWFFSAMLAVPGEPRAAQVHAARAATMAAVKSSLQPGLQSSKEILIDESRCIGFMGKEGMVYATPRMVSDVEYTCRDFLLAHLDAGEDSVGTQVVIDHLAATPLGLRVKIGRAHV